jgi:Pentapeptide repeats (8 copies)
LAAGSEPGKLSRRLKRVVDVTRARAGKLAHNAEWIFGRRAARVLGVVTLFAVVVALLLVVLNWYVAPTKPSEKKDLVLALAQILGGTALLSGLYFTWRTLQVNREGQITDRFTRAIDQLGRTDDEGNKRFEIRLGGIYALERIARESKEDHWPIMDVLTAYVRQHAPRRPLDEGQEGAEDATVDKKSEEDSREATKKTTDVPAPAPDIQAIMTVLRRRTRFFGHGEPERLDLHETNLRGALLWLANFSGADFTEANLSGANLIGTNLWDAYLLRANLSGAVLAPTDLIQAQLGTTHGDENTQLPTGLKPPAHWGVKTDEQTEGD